MTTAQLMRLILGLVPLSVRDKIKHVPYLAQLQHYVVSGALDGREFTHLVDVGPAKGITFQIRMPEDKGIWTGTYERDFAARLARAVGPGVVTYDIGSWHGFFAGVMAAQGASQVHVFEPLPANAARIGQLVALNPDKSITLHNCAVGERDAEVDLIVMPETSMAKLESSTFQRDKTSGTRVRVAVRSIDSIVAAGEAPSPSLMKIDVEGAEVFVLKGATATLRFAQPEIFAEIHSSRLLAECEALLGAEGYAIEHLDPGSAEARAKDVFQIRAFPNKPA